MPDSTDSKPATSRDVTIPCGGAAVSGVLTSPERLSGLVIFAHGSGSGRHSPRNQFVARSLVDRGFATLLMDLLTEPESADRRNVFDITLLGRRVVDVTQWAANDIELTNLKVGYFGASTGAAAALVAAAVLGDQIKAVVSRGGRPDLAGDALPQVTAPTLLLVGSLDDVVIDLNKQAQAMMKCETKLSIIPGATHLFEEPGTLEQVAREAGEWFERWIGTADERG